MATIGPSSTPLAPATAPGHMHDAPGAGPSAPQSAPPVPSGAGGTQAAQGLAALAPVLSQLATVLQGLVQMLAGSQALGGGAAANPSQACTNCCEMSGAPTAPPSPTTPPVAGGGPAPSLSGTFRNVGKSVSGEASVSTDASGQQVLNLRNFRSDAGPDVHVYLTPNVPADGSEPADVIDLGPLSSFSGDQSLPIPPGTDLSKYNTVTIWCDQANSTFGAATLT